MIATAGPCHPLVRPPLRTPQKLLDCEADILGDLAQQRRRDVPPGVKRDGPVATISVPILLVGTPLSDPAKPRPSRSAATSRGLSVGRLPTTQP